MNTIPYHQTEIVMSLYSRRFYRQQVNRLHNITILFTTEVMRKK
jgi:hypothetical protein